MRRLRSSGRPPRCFAGRAILFLLAAVFGGGLDVTPVRASESGDASELRVMTWNIHHGAGVDGRLDLERIAGLIRQAGVDLVALQEVDRGVQRTDRRDLPAELASLTGLACVFSNNFHYQGGEYGNALLSRLPISEWTNAHYRMLRDGEQRGLLQAVVTCRGRPLRFFSTHLDYRPDGEERLAHVAAIRAAVEAQPETPAIVAGDFNETPDGGVHRAMTEFLIDAWAEAGVGPGATYPSAKPVRRIDYVFVTPGWAVVESANVPETRGSDHAPLVVVLRVPDKPESE